MEIFPLEYGFGDFSFEKWRFFLEDLFWRLNFWKKFNEDLFREIFPLEYGFGDFSFWRFILEIELLKKNLMKICSWRFFLWNMVLEIFPFEDLFVEIFPWRFILEIELLKKKLMKICSWRFFLEDLFLEIFPLKFWKFLLKICSLEIFPLEYGFGDFSYEKWKIFLLKMEIYFMITKWRRWRWTRNDEDLFMRQEWWWFFLNIKNVDFEWE